MPHTPLVVIGASAGGIEAIRKLLPAFPADLEAAVVIVIHREAIEEDDRLARVLAHRSKIPVAMARHE